MLLLKKKQQTPYLWCGHYYGNLSFRILISFDLEALTGKYRILAAYLKMYVNKTFFKNTIVSSITPYRIVEPWEEATVTWEKQPSYTTNTPDHTAHIAGEGWVLWNVSNTVRKWCEAGKPNYGFLLKSTELPDFEAKRFYSSKESINIHLHPRLIIAYEPLFTSWGTDVRIAARAINNKIEDVVTSDCDGYSTVQDTSQSREYTFFVKNLGTDNTAIVQLQISPNGTDFIFDNIPKEIPPGKVVSLIPCVFAHFTRVVYRSKDAGKPTPLRIWYQSQV